MTYREWNAAMMQLPPATRQKVTASLVEMGHITVIVESRPERKERSAASARSRRAQASKAATKKAPAKKTADETKEGSE